MNIKGKDHRKLITLRLILLTLSDIGKVVKE